MSQIPFAGSSSLPVTNSVPLSPGFTRKPPPSATTRRAISYLRSSAPGCTKAPSATSTPMRQMHLPLPATWTAPAAIWSVPFTSDNPAAPRPEMSYASSSVPGPVLRKPTVRPASVCAFVRPIGNLKTTSAAPSPVMSATSNVVPELLLSDIMSL